MPTFSEKLYRQLLESFPPERAYATESFSRPPMPPAVARYLSALLAQRVEDEVENTMTKLSAYLPKDQAELREATDHFNAALRRYAHFPPDAWPDALREGTDRVSGYLIAPGATLASVVFRGQKDEVSTSLVLQKMEAFEAYGYLREVVAAYFEQKDLTVVGQDRLRSLLTRIDRQMTDDYDATAWVSHLEPLFDLCARLATDDDGVPVADLRRFFAGKDRADVVRHLDSAEESRLTRAGLRRVLTAAERDSKDPREAPETETAATDEPSAPEETAKRSTGPVPLWKKYQQTDAAPTPADKGPEEPMREPEPGQPLWQTFRSSDEHDEPEVTEEKASAAVADLERAVLGRQGPGNRHLFVKNLFSGSVDDYERTLRRLKEAATWTAASQIIAREVFRKHQVNIYSEPAVAFTDAVEAQYRKGS